MTRVLHIFSRLNRGGAELRTVDVLRRLEPQDAKLEFAALSGLPGELDEEIHSYGGRVHYCKLDAGFPWRFAKLLRERRIDVVHSHVHHFSGYILRCAGLAGIPIRIAHFRSCHSGKRASLRRWLQERLTKHWIDRWATLILGNGAASVEFSWKSDWRSDSRCAVIHNGLDTSSFDIEPDPEGVRQELGLPIDSQLVIHVGRMDPAKNHERLIRIWASLANKSKDTHFVSVGRLEPTLLAQLQSQLPASLRDRIVWAGVRVDIARLLLAADLMYFPSRWEGLPGAVLEASAAGVPVIGSDIPSIREIATHLPHIATLSLDSDDRLWVAAGIAATADRLRDRATARQLVDSSVYGIDLCVAAHKAAWKGTNAAGIRDIYENETSSPSMTT